MGSIRCLETRLRPSDSLFQSNSFPFYPTYHLVPTRTIVRPAVIILVQFFLSVTATFANWLGFHTIPAYAYVRIDTSFNKSDC